MAETKQFRNLTEYHNGNSAENNIKLSDTAPFQHENLTTNTNKLGKMNMAQTFCEPVAVCNSNSPADGAYTATCVNYPDFAVSYDDSHGTSHYLYGMKVRVIFTYGITYGSVSSGTYPTLSINGSGALPLLAQGKTMAQGAIVAGQSVEFTIIPYGNSIAFDADSNVRENTNDYTIYTDGNGRTNVVAANNFQSVTSAAVAQKIKEYMYLAGGNISVKCFYGYELVQGSKDIDLSSIFNTISCVIVSPVSSNYSFIASGRVVNNNQINIRVMVDGVPGNIECYWFVMGI